ncbi:MAG: GNAT family N-acetyltransferase [Oscillospiraceae bacterium]|nr:GNAT family N-acetyltransferase [Oscillospiraceae bacterium]
MKLRKLAPQDAPLMLEWMHDPSVVGHLSTNFGEKTLEDCQGFIAWANSTQSDLHLAVADEADTYMGTVSLKHIHNGTAEFAITVRAAAMGKGYAPYGMAAILEMGIRKLGLDAIYWCVSRHNARAVRFYDKNNYLRTEAVPASIRDAYTPEQNADFIWYVYR